MSRATATIVCLTDGNRTGVPWDEDDAFAASTPALAGLGVETVRRDDEVIVVLRGEFDLCTAPLLQGVLAEDQVQAARAVLVDLENVAFMDLSGLRPLVSLALPERDGFHVALTTGSPQVQWLLELTGLRHLLNVVPPSTTP